MSAAGRPPELRREAAGLPYLSMGLPTTPPSFGFLTLMSATVFRFLPVQNRLREQAVPIGVQSGIEHPIRQNRRRPLPRSGVPIFAVLLIAEDLTDTLNEGNAVRGDNTCTFDSCQHKKVFSVFA